MILADTSVWVDHLRNGNSRLAELLDQSQVLMHPFVVGELALGSLRQRDVVLSSMQDLPQATVAIDSEVMGFIDRRELFSLGIGYIDAHLLASVQLTEGASLWTRDKRLLAAAERLALAADVAR